VESAYMKIAYAPSKCLCPCRRQWHQQYSATCQQWTTNRR